MSLELSYLGIVLNCGKFAQGMRGLRVCLEQSGKQKAGWGSAAAGIDAAAPASEQQRRGDNREPQ